MGRCKWGKKGKGKHDEQTDRAGKKGGKSKKEEGKEIMTHTHSKKCSGYMGGREGEDQRGVQRTA